MAKIIKFFSCFLIQVVYSRLQKVKTVVEIQYKGDYEEETKCCSHIRPSLRAYPWTNSSILLQAKPTRQGH